MEQNSNENLTQLLKDAQAGNRQSLDEFLPLVYDELKRVAAHKLSFERANHTLQATALVHEAYLRLIDQHSVNWQNRAHFFAAAAENIGKAINIYNQIIKTDASNVEVQKFKFEAQIKLGNIKFAEKNYPAATEIYKNALSELQNSSSAKNSDYLQFAEGWITEKIGDTFAAQNDKPNARANYEKTLQIWQNEKTAPTNHGFSAAKINYLREKVLR